MVEAAAMAIDDIHEDFKLQLQTTADDLRVQLTFDHYQE